MVAKQEYLGASPQHVDIWKFCKDLCTGLNIQISENALLQTIVAFINRLSADSRKVCIVKASGAFFSDSRQLNYLIEQFKQIKE